MTDKRKPREPVYELDKKIQFLLDSPVARRFCNHSGKLDSLRQKTGLTRSEIRGAVEKENGREPSNKLNTDAQCKLAKNFNFSVNWPEWIDPQANRLTQAAERSDTADHFKERYLRDNKSRTNGQPTQPRRTDGRLKVSRPYAAQAFDSHLACIDLHASQPGAGEPWPISVDLICWPAPVEGVVIAVKRGRLQIECDKAHTTDLRDRAGYPDGADYSREACKIVIRPAGHSQQPSWEIVADPGPIGLLSLPHDFCPVFDIAAGDTIAGSFRAYIKDLDLVELHEPDDDGDVASREDSFSFMRADFRILGSAKQRILKRLAEMKLPGGDSGWAQLCRDALQFKEIGDAADE